MLYESSVPVGMHVLLGDANKIKQYDIGAIFIHVGILTFRLGPVWGRRCVTDHVFIAPGGEIVSRGGDRDFSRFSKIIETPLEDP